MPQQPNNSAYPCWRYHPTEREKLIQSPEQEAALAPEWRDRPYPPPPEAPAEAPECPNCQALKAENERMAAQFDKGCGELLEKDGRLIESHNDLIAKYENLLALHRKALEDLEASAKAPEPKKKK